MGEEILSQSEIDALLQLIDDEVQPGDGWQPGEREALEQVGALIAEAVVQTWPQTPGISARVSPPQVDQAAAGMEPVPNDAGVWVVAGLSGAARGLLAVWLGGQACVAMAEKILGRPPGAEGLAGQDVERVGKGVSAFFPPLADALGHLTGEGVLLEPAEAQWTGAGGAAAFLSAMPGFDGPVVRFMFPCQVSSARGDLVVLWPLADARAFLARIESAGPGVSAPSHTTTAPAQPVQEAEFQAFGGTGQAQTPQNIELILDVPMALTVELGRTERQIREILALGPGSVVELERIAGEAVDVMVNGKLIAKGEVVVVDENFGVRVTEIVSRAERVRKLR